MRALAFDEIVTAAVGPRPGTVRPYPAQSVTGIAGFLRAQFDGAGARSVIVLGVDGVDFPTAAAWWRPDALVPLVTTFPSTSVVAWRSALVGAGPEVHGVPGVVYLDESCGRLFHAFRDRTLDRGDDWAGAEPADAVALPDVPTVFELLQRDGIECLAAAGDLVSWPGRWRDSTLRGARLCGQPRCWPAVRRDAALVVDAATGDVERALAGRRGRRLVWSWLNLDDYLHARGYDGELLASLAAVDAAARRWAAGGHLVVAHSDHGLVPSRAPTSLVAAWDRANGPDLCRLPAGGAGRVRWSYPHPGRIGTVRRLLAAGLGTSALVTERSELADLGLVPPGDPLGEAVGPVVAIALGEDFPVPDPAARFEHGSITSPEMVVPLAVWAPPGLTIAGL
jgi:hypothetical protein